jgi:hypothetical protein
MSLAQRLKASDLAILLQEGEGTTLEFKENLSASLAREMVAFANTIGGRILLGVRDDGTVVGVKDSNALRARIQDMARNCDPPVKVVVDPVGGVVVVHVRASDAKPVQCSEGFFWRQGAVTQKLSRDEIRDFFRAEGAIRFDLAPCPSFRYPQDFDRAKYNAWLRLSGITGRPRTEDVLVNIEAAERAGGKLLFRNAGVLFFAKNVRHFFNRRPAPSHRLHREGGHGREAHPRRGARRRLPGAGVGGEWVYDRDLPAEAGGAGGGGRDQARAGSPRKYPPSTPQVLAVLAKAGAEATREELQRAAGLRDRKHFREQILGPLLRAGLLELSIPDKPRSSKQRYRLTEAGATMLDKVRRKK